MLDERTETNSLKIDKCLASVDVLIRTVVICEQI